MTSRFRIIIFAFVAIVQNAIAWEPKSPKECRLAFLMGMTTIGDPGSDTAFPPASDPRRRVFDEIARLYSADMGASAEELATEKWRDRVETALEACRRRSTSESWMSLVATFGEGALRDPDLSAAFLAGAYASHGTSTGFRLVNQRKGLYIAWLVRSVFFSVTIDAKIRPGIPGNIIVTIDGAGDQTVQWVISELEGVRIALTRR
jgi:hypothetical protein